ncbi:MAG: RagB/SusD family nutrient uptake outer membrane protein [Bacteroidales bacterium]|nr:RagB/SusD family nutrient uptake outer membrane protein [Bacteroidales bacterium]
MKKIIYISIAILTASIFASCNPDLLEIPQKGVDLYEDFYNGSPENAAEAAVTIMQSVGQMYTTGAGFGINGVDWCIGNSRHALTNGPSDDIYWGSGDKGDHVFGLEINEYRPSFGSRNSVIAQQYYVCYQLIRNCNLLLENWEESSDPTIKRARAEARLFRAMAHFHLATYWGDVIKVEKTLTGEERPEVTPQAEVFKWCIDEIAAIENDLPSKSGLNDKALAIRATKEFALALKGKIQVFAKDWKGAKASLKAVINSGKYALVPGTKMSEILHGECDACEEKILDLNYLDFPGVRLTGKNHGQANQADMWRSGNGGFWGKTLPTKIIQSEGWGGGGNPSKSFVEAIMSHEPDSYRRKAWIMSYDEMIEELDWNGFEGQSVEEKKMNPKIGIQPGYHYFGSVGYFSMKRAPRRADLNANTDSNTHENQNVMRYAEVLLLYAEACAMDNDNDGLQYLNMVAERAGAPTYSSLTMENVKQEKRFEMFVEGTRFADLVRWGDAATVLKDQGKEVPSFYDDFYDPNTGEPTGRPHHFIVDYSDAYYTKAGEYGFVAGKNERMPFPYNTVSQNENLNQNPGWN